MAPPKQSRPSSEVENSETQAKQDSTAATPSVASQNIPDKVKESGTVARANDEPRSRSWYGGGTWPRKQKSTPSIQVARESILAGKLIDTPQSAELAPFEPRKTEVQSSKAAAPRPAFLDPGKSKETLDLVSSKPSVHSVITNDCGDAKDGNRPFNSKSMTGDSPDTLDAFLRTHDNTKIEPIDTSEPLRPIGWLEWLRVTKTQQDLDKTQESRNVPIEFQPPNEVSHQSSMDGKQPQSPLTTEPSSELMPLVADTQPKPAKTTTLWAGLWQYSTTISISGSPSQETSSEPEVIKRDSGEDKPAEDHATANQNGSSWAFWSKQTSKTDGGPAETQLGELAVAGEVSQDHPVPAQTNCPSNSNEEVAKQSKRGTSPLSSIQDQRLPLTYLPSKPNVASSSLCTKAVPPNLLLPSFLNTYHLMESPSVIKQIARLLLHGRQSPANHVFLTKDPPNIKKAIAIGIHGLFPAQFLRTVIGQPTGTSIRFANHAAAAISRWADKHGFDCEVEKVALEGEGKIAERVDHLWKLLLNWIEHVRQADFILVACHSQGVPVALMLTAKLIALGVVTSARIGICAMAGVSLGPFPDYKSRFFSGSAAELFEFADLDSSVSQSYQESLRVALKYGVRVTYVGSIDDQLVSLESAIFSPVEHPYIYRSVFVDGRVHAPDFIAHLVGFALKLRNLGVSDHQLIRALSAPLAGSLYTGEGHSRLYDEERIYDLAVQFALETTSVDQNVPLKVERYEPPINANPFQLPWSMRGLLEENVVKTELDQESKELLQQFDEWKPTTKVLKDVKYRLEVIKSKL